MNVDQILALALKYRISPEQALQEWQRGAEMLEAAKERNQARRDAKIRLGQIPKPAHWPASMDDFCLMIVGARDKQKREERFRQWLAAICTNPDQQFAWVKEMGIPGPLVWNWLATSYTAWWKAELHTRKVKAGQAAQADAPLRFPVKRAKRIPRVRRREASRQVLKLP